MHDALDNGTDQLTAIALWGNHNVTVFSLTPNPPHTISSRVGGFLRFQLIPLSPGTSDPRLLHTTTLARFIFGPFLVPKPAHLLSPVSSRPWAPPLTGEANPTSHVPSSPDPPPPLHEHSPAINRSANQSWSAPLPVQDFDQIRLCLSGELGNEKSRPMPPRRRAAVGAGPSNLPPRPPTPPFPRVIESR
ncbi:hypothetical protein LX32DRAFT_250642 [Colletotrichum zoysiae]|uniref:Uncharacterized protein n=1 Tax=Colletotrichum zoysiae TaxID=1216348 RepID=A0AAD9H3E3_9PEZI|nr:hypothetical protein LX32DRAFT_250642 [Colletotrichum zoysiae]